MDKPFAITLNPGSSLANKTGSWRTERPIYVDLMPPCNHACPAGENIQQWLYHAEDSSAEDSSADHGGYEAAWRQIMQDNPLPAIMGRVCYRPCETACNRAQVDEAVGINSVERFLGDEAIRQGWTVPITAPDTGRRVLIVGAGPSGLSAAYHLRLLGHQVTLRDTAVWAGGMMRFGIPAYRLPRDVLDAEVGRILAMGVDLGRRPPGHRHRGGHGGRRLRRGVPRGRRAEGQARLHPGRRLGQDPRCGHAAALHGGRASRRSSAAASRSTAAATPRWTRPGPPGASAPPTPSWCTGAPGTRCPRTTSRSRRPPTKACG